MISVLFYGNCQPAALMRTICFDKTKYISTYIPCYQTELDESSFLKYILESNIIITQSINDNYRNKHYLSTSFVINNAKETTKIIIFDSCHFNFYYFDLTYKKIDNELIRKPIDYHYNTMIDYYKNNLSAEKYIEDCINNVDIKTNEDLEIIANKSLLEMNMRYTNIKLKYVNTNIYIISIYDYVKENYKKKLLFYSMNHPTKYVFQYISEQIINYLHISNNIDYNIDTLNNQKCIIYKCIQKNVNFNISECIPLLNGLTDINLIVKQYYEEYKKISI